MILLFFLIAYVYAQTVSNLTKQCPPQCASCSSQNLCDSCKDGFIYNPIRGTCNCPQRTFKDPQSLNCLSICTNQKDCSIGCTACQNKSSCDQCDNGLNRILNQNKACQCMDGYYASSTNLSSCVICDINCRTCKGPNSDNCLSCPNGKVLNGSRCLCMDGYYQDTNFDCKQCDSSCKACLNQTTCSSCSAYQLRVLKGGQCLCLDGYYEDQEGQCLTCPYSCSTCQNNSHCLTCDSNSFRIMMDNSTKCKCRDGYFDDGFRQLCKKCVSPCAACFKGNKYSCLSCNQKDNRNLSKNQCLCQPGYFESSQNQTCTKCPANCSTCKDDQTCLGCKPNMNLILNDQGLCVCAVGYALNEGVCKPITSNPTSTNPYICMSMCSSCNDNITCSGCFSDQNRYLNKTQCSCLEGYYDNGTDQCNACSPSCLGCSGSSSNDCLSCKSSENKILSSNRSCICDEGYYMDSNNGCQPCIYPCFTCSSQTECQSCFQELAFIMVNESCVCGTQQYYDSTSQICRHCHHSCDTCQNDQQCLTCNASGNRVFDQGNCNCLKGFYDDGFNQSCQACNSKCQECFFKDQMSCVACSTNLNRHLVGSYCLCNEGYFDSGQDNCEQCPPICKSCFDLNVCISCFEDQLREKDQNQNCSCPKGFYESNETLICQRCDTGCETCENSSSCLSCIQGRVMDFQNQCVCYSNYYEDENGTCQMCSQKCNTCIGPSEIQCTDCGAGTQRYLVYGQCLCNQGYFEQNHAACERCDPICLACVDSAENCIVYHCQSGCLTCDGPNQDDCIQCDDGLQLDDGICKIPCQLYYLGCYQPTSIDCNQFNLCDQSITEDCKCKDSYYLTYDNYCSQCQYQCLTCEDPFYCISCDSALNRVLRDNDCFCKIGYFESSINQLCLPCDPTCFMCNGSSPYQCLKCFQNQTLIQGVCYCQDGHLRLPNQQQCFQNCPEGYYTSNGYCIACYEGCLECSGPEYFDCTKCDEDSQFQIRFHDLKSYYLTSEQTNIMLKIKNDQCVNNTLTQLQTPQIDVKFKTLDEQGNAIFNTSVVYLGQDIQILIPEYTFIIDKQYQIMATIYYDGNELSWSEYITFSHQRFYAILKNYNFTVIKGEIKEINLEIYDLDYSRSPVPDVTEYCIIWTCEDPETGQVCTYQDESEINFAQYSSFQVLHTSRLSVAQVLKIIVSISRGKEQLQISSLIHVVEDIQTSRIITLQYNPDLIQKKQNIDSLIDLEFIIDDITPNQLIYYSTIIIYDGQRSSAIQSVDNSISFKISQLKYNFTLWDGSEVIILVVGYDASTGNKYQGTLKIVINQPPSNCSLQYLSKGVEFDTIFPIRTIGCLDQDLPLTYQFHFYTTEESLYSDIYLNQQFTQGIILREQVPTNQLSTYLTTRFDKESSSIIYIASIITDSLGSKSIVYSNITIFKKLDPKKILRVLDANNPLDQTVLNILLASLRFSYDCSQDNASLTVKKQIWSMIGKIEAKLTNSFLSQQIQQAKNYLLMSGELLNKFSSNQVLDLLKKVDTQIENLNQILFSMSTTSNISSVQQEQQKQKTMNAVNNYAGIISSVIELSINSRDKSQIASQTIATLNKLADVTAFGSDINSQSISVVESSFNMTVDIQGEENLQTQTFRLRGQSQIRKLQQNSDQAYYYVKQIEFKKNIKRFEASFPYPDQNNELYYYDLKRLSSSKFNIYEAQESSFDNSNTISINIKKTQLSQKNTPWVCMVFDKDTWMTNECNTSEFRNYVQCTCNSLGFYTIVEDVDGLFTQSSQNPQDSVSDVKKVSTMIGTIYIALVSYLLIGFFLYVCIRQRTEKKEKNVIQKDEKQTPNPELDLLEEKEVVLELPSFDRNRQDN